MYYIIILIPLLYYIFIYFFFRYIYNNKFKCFINCEHVSIFKDKEFIIFNHNLFNFYYSTAIILSYFLFKNNYLFLLLDFNISIIFLFLFIFLLYFIIINNYFIYFIFYLYLELKKAIHNLNKINFDSIINYNSKSLNLKNKFNHIFSRSFSTSTNLKNNINHDENNNSLEKAIAVKEFKKNYKGGYLGYTDTYNLGNIALFGLGGNLAIKEFSGLAYELELKLKDFLSLIPENIIYSILPVLRWEFYTGVIKTITITKSTKITRFTSSSLLAKKIILAIQESLNTYKLTDTDIDIYLMSRPWLSAAEFSQDMSSINKLFNDQIEKEISGLTGLATLDIRKNLHYKDHILFYYNYKDNYMDSYGDPIFDKKNNLIGYKLNNSEAALVETFYNDNNLLCNKISIKEFDKESLTLNGETLNTWTDTKTNFGFTRELDNKKYFYDLGNNLINVEKSFNCSQFPTLKTELNLNSKIGTIDFETYGSDLGLGQHQVFAGGWAIKNKTRLHYKGIRETSEQLVNKVFTEIFMDKTLNDYTFYAHNLGRFDSIFILKSLIENKNLTITPIWKDNSILSLTINQGDFKIKLLDSLQLISGSLENILISFNSSIKKGTFPYDFVNKNNLNYIGEKPAKEYFSNVSDQEYSSIENKNWNLKIETLKYLKADLEGLLEVLIKFSEKTFKKYKLNIVNFKTLPSLALSSYISSYLPNDMRSKLKIIKGELEREIRTADFGGNVEVYINEIETGYLYDINSQYPSAMLKDMPVGDPILSLEKNLNNIFGFVYGEISSPDEQTLQVPFIQHRNPFNNLISCPRGKFKRLIFSEEIKYALRFGYKRNIEYCYIFERGKDLFKDFVIDHYKIKNTTKDPIQKSIAKLFLNSLYGRMGMKDIEDYTKIVGPQEAAYLDKNTNVSIFSKLNKDKYIVRYSGNISERIRKLYTTQNKESLTLDVNKSRTYTKTEIKKLGFNKQRTVPSAVHIAAAISSYARMIINEYKNIPGNPCFMSDTDSAVLPHPLPEHLVGNNLGQMKLVNKIKKGVFIKKKFYYIQD